MTDTPSEKYPEFIKAERIHVPQSIRKRAKYVRKLPIKPKKHKSSDFNPFSDFQQFIYAQDQIRRQNFHSHPFTEAFFNFQSSSSQNTSSSSNQAKYSTKQATSDTELFGLHPPFTQTVVKTVYRSLAKIYHPDKFTQNCKFNTKWVHRAGLGQPKTVEECTSIFQRIQTAFETLSK